ncbi:hypothetical protein KFU94_69435 [Chloroflexi bacterium TSY]|nr:hypothetical protein [Chloroflexi bacterium TSY]
MTTSERRPNYRIFLLTVWTERPTIRAPTTRHGNQCGQQTIWRFRLEDPRTGQQRGFASVEALLAALQTGFAGVDNE